MKHLRYKKTKIILVTLLISLLLHLIASFFFLEYGFSKRFTSFIHVFSSSILSPEERRSIEEKRARKREALQKILQAARNNKKSNKKIIEFTKPKPEPKPKPDAKTKPDIDFSAKLTAPKSNFGWVIFDDNYKKPDKVEIPKAKDGDLIKSEESDVAQMQPEDFNSKVVVFEVKQKSQNKKKNNADLGIKPDKQEIKLVQAEQAPKEPEGHVSEKNIQAEIAKTFEEIKAIPNTAIIDEAKKPIVAEMKKTVEIVESIVPIQEEESGSTNQQDVVADDFPAEDKIKEKEMQQDFTQQGVENHSVELQDKAQEREALLGVLLKKKNKPGYNKQAKGSKFIWGLSNSDIGQAKKEVVLTKGYFYTIGLESGTDLIDRDGDPNKKANPEEMKYTAYYTKLASCIKSTWEYNSDFYMYMLPNKAGIYTYVMELEIDCSGRLINSRILKSSGHEGLDKVVIRNLRFASPFSPLPKSFNAKIHKMSVRGSLIVG